MDSNIIPSNRMLQLLHSSSPCINHSWGQLNHVKIQICLLKTIICTFLPNSLLHFTTMRSFTLAGSQYWRPHWTLFVFEGANQAEKFFTTLLAFTRLLDFGFTTLPYPTRNLKTTTLQGLVTISFSLLGLCLYLELLRQLDTKTSPLKMVTYSQASPAN